MPSSPRRFEISTLGVDPQSQGLTTDPFSPTAYPTSLGLRIPSVLPGSGTQPRYLFLLATLNISRGRIKVRGIRQGLTIGAYNLAQSPTPFLMEEFLVTSPFWHFPDGNVSWHLVREPADRREFVRPNTDGPSWAFRETSTSAMLYEKASYAAGFAQPSGAPINYSLGLETYQPPFPYAWQPIAGMGNMKDMRSPWNAPTNAIAMDEIVEGTCRVSLYASVLQTNPATCPRPNILGAGLSAATFYPGGLTPETAFHWSFTQSGQEGANYGVRYASVFGAILFEDLQADSEEYEPLKEKEARAWDFARWWGRGATK